MTVQQEFVNRIKLAIGVVLAMDGKDIKTAEISIPQLYRILDGAAAAYEEPTTP